MSRILTIICAVALVVAFATTAKAEVQNVKVGGDITTYGIWRDDYDLNASGSGTDDDAWYMTTTRLQIDADLTDNVSATVRIFNQRDWGQDENSATTDIDLDLAYITLKEMLYSPMTLTIGRQELSDLTDLVVGDPDTNDSETVDRTDADDLSADKAFDAIRADLDYAPWTITLLTAKIDDSDIDGGHDTTDLYGVNFAYDFAEYDANGAGYVFYDNQDVVGVDREIAIIGLKGNMAPVENLTLAGEVALQTGDYTATRDQDAWALDIGGNYVWTDSAYKPNLGLAYYYRSGEKAGTTSGDYEAWDTMYENQTHGIVANYLFGGQNDGVDSNCHIIHLSGGFMPVEAVTLALDYYHYILDEELVTSDNTSYAFSNSQASSMTLDHDDDFGDEVDLKLTYDYTEDVQFGLCYGIFMPGDAFDATNNDDASQVLGSVKVVF